MKKVLFFLMTLAVLLPWAANAQLSLPYSEGFEDYSSGLPTGWTKVGSGTVAVQSTSSQVHQGSKSLKFSDATSNVVALPQFAKEINKLQISLYSKAEGNYSSCGYFDVGYVTDLTDASTFVQVKSDYYSSFTSYGPVGPVSMASAPDGAYIALRHRPTSTYYYWFVDDIYVEELPACPYPTNLQASGVTHEEATITWTSDESAWQIVWSTNENFDPDAVTPTPVTAKSYTITGLTALTDYYVYVRSNCTASGNGYSVWSDKYHFKTTAQAEVVGDSWSDNFEGESCGWELVNGTLTNANWAWGTAVNNGGTHAIYISNDGGISNAYNNSGYAVVFATKLLNFTTGKYTFSYDWKCVGESSYDNLRVGLVPASLQLEAINTSTNSVPNGWVALHDGTYLSAQSTWQHVDKTVSEVTAGNYYLVLRWRQDNSGSDGVPAAVDNVTITRVACPYDVAGLAVADDPAVTQTTATVTWTAGEATQWQVAIKTGDAEWTILPTIYSTNSAALTGLTTATTYQVKARAYCNANDQGTWCEPITLTTACPEYATIPFNEDFDGYTVASTVYPSTRILPTCWNFINTSTYSTNQWYPTMQYYSYTDYSNSSPNYIRFYIDAYSNSNYDPKDQYLILPAVQDVDGLRIKLQASAYNTGSTYDATFKVGVMSDPTDASTFVEIAEKTPTTTNYEQYTIPFNSYTGSGSHIAIKVEAPETPSASYTHAYRAVYIDDITVEAIPSCLEPTVAEVVENSETTNSVQLTWTSGNETPETNWKLQYKKATDQNYTTVNVTSAQLTDGKYTLSGLNSSSTYNWRVAAWCDPSNAEAISEYTAGPNFSTECEAMTITSNEYLQEGFEDYTGVNYDATNGVIPTCWIPYSTNSVAPHVIGSGSYYYYHTGTKALTFYGNGTNYAALPEISNDLNTLQVKFWMRVENSSNGTLTLGYITDEDNGQFNTFTAIPGITIANSSTMVERGPYYLNSIPDNATRLVFRWYYGSQYSCCIDDLEVSLAPTCRPVTNLNSTAQTAHTATLSWTNGAATQNAWQIAYSTDADFDPSTVTPVDVTTNPATIEGLAQSTTYYAYVRANCGNDGYSAWNTTKVTFSTLAGNVTPTGLAVAGNTITSSQATASWNAVAGNTLHESYDIYWVESPDAAPVTAVPENPTAPNLISGITATSQVISDLTPETKYRVWVRDNCGTDGYSNWSSAVTFTTASACQTPDGLAANSVTNNSATLSWNAYGQTGFNLQYRVSGEEWDANNIISNVNTPYSMNPILTGNTTYQVRVQAACADPTSEASWSNATSFTTECGAEQFPWSENFDNWTSKSVCWSFRKGQYNMGQGTPTTYSSAWTLNSSYGSYITIDGKALTMNLYSTNEYWAVTPAIDITTDDAVLKVDVAVAAYSSATPNYDDNDTLAFAISTDGGATFANLRVLDGDDLNDLGNDYTTIYVPVAGYNGQAVRFAIYGGSISGTSPYDNRCVIDNVSVEEAPSCYPVGTLAEATDITPFSAKLSWGLIDNTQDGWRITYATNAELTENMHAITVTSHENYTLSGLTPETHYYVAVCAFCGAPGYGAASNIIEFTTGIACQKPTDLAYSNLQQTSVDLSWTENGTASAWKVAYKAEDAADFSETMVLENPYTLGGLTQGTNYTVKVRAICGGDYGNSQWSDEITFMTVASCPAPENLAVTQYSETAHGATITWDGNAQNDSYIIEYRQAIIPATDVNTTYDFEDDTQGWTTIDADGHGDAWNRQSSEGNNAASCMRAAYNINYAHQDYLVSPQITLGGTLSFYAKRESTSYSDNFRVFLSTSGNTDAADFSIELTEGDVTPTTSYSQYTYDLSSYSGTGYVAIVYTAPSNQYYLYIDDINYTVSVEGEYGEWQDITNVTGTSYTFGTETVSLTPETNYQVRVKGDCNGTPSPASNIVGFTTLVACPAPTGLSVDPSSITHNSVGLSWTASGTQTNWVVAYKADGDADFTEKPVTENPCTLGDLAPETQYTVKVKTDCGNEGSSTWSNEEIFTTLEACGTPTDFTLGDVEAHQASFSWTAGNGNTAWKVYVKKHVDADYPDTYTNANADAATINELDDNTTYDVKIVPTCDDTKSLEVANAFTSKCEAITIDADHSFTENFDATTFPPTTCWNSIASGTREWTKSTSSTYNHSGTTSGSAYSGYYGDIYLLMPDFSISNDNTDVLLTFWSYNTYTSDYDKNSVILINGNTETELWSPTSVTEAWKKDTINLSAYKGQTISLAFKYEGSNDHGWYVDDIEVAFVPACVQPTDLAATDVTANEATLSWTGTNDSYTLRYKEESTFTPIFTEDFEGELGDWTLTDCDEATNINTTDAHYGDNSFRFSYNENPPQYLISPELTGVVEGSILEFWYKNYSSNNPETFQIGISTTNNNVSDFTFGADITASDEEWHQYNATIPEGTKYICWKLTSDDQYYLFIDDVQVGNTVGSTWTTVNNITTTSTQLTGLTAGVTYEAQVQAVCGESTSDWSELITFTPSCYTFQLLTDVSDLAEGDKIIIAAANDNVAMSTTQNSNNRAVETIVKNGNKLEEPSDEVQILTLAAGTANDSWAFNTGNGYLFAVASGSNYLRTQSDIDDNASWTITVSGGKATIKANGENDKYMRYNNNNSIISCYSTNTTQQDLAIYKLIDNRGKGDTIANVTITEDFYAWRGHECTTSGDYEAVLSGASANGCDSVLTLHLTLQHKVAIPTFDPIAGTYTDIQTVTIACSTDGANIYYTTDGTTPDANSTLYAGALTLTKDTTIKAIAIKEGDEWVNSDVATAEYAINVPVYTVTLDAGNGSLNITGNTKEGNSLNPIDLSNVTATLDNCDGWNFAGWSTSSVNETTTAPALVSNSYIPTNDITLYAVYKKTEGGRTFDATTGGEFTMFATVSNTNYYAQGTGAKLSSTTTASEATTYTFVQPEGYGDNEFAIKTGTTYLTYSSGTNLSTSTDPYKWTLSSGTRGTWRISSQTNGRALIFRAGSTNQFGGYATSNISSTGTEYFDIEIGGSASTTTYNSNPTCITYYHVNISNNTSQDGNFTINPDLAAEGTVITLTPSVNTNYHLTGWNFEDAQGGSVDVTLNPDNNTFVMPAFDVFVAMQTAPDEYNITWHLNDGVYTGNGILPSSYTFGTAYTLPVANEMSKEHYNFSGWYDNTNLEGDAVTEITATEFGEKEFWAEWTPMTYTITASANPTAGGTIEGAGDYNYNTTATLKATANTGYSFANWTEGSTVVSTEATYGFTVTSARELVANFTANEYTITYMDGETQLNQETYEYNASVTAIADPTKEGYTFTGWDPAVPSTMPSSNVTVYAQWQINTYNLTVTQATGGTISVTVGNNNPETESTTADYNAQVALTAMPAANYLFSNWVVTSGETTIAVENNQFNMPAGDVTVTAVFTPMDVVATPTFTPVAGTYNDAQQVTINCTTEGASIYYTMDGSEPSTSSTLYDDAIAIYETATLKAIAVKQGMVNSNVATALYRIVPKYNVVIADNIVNGTVTAQPTSDTTGATITLTAEPATGYHFGSWHVTSGNDVIEVNNNSFVMPAGNVIVSAIFEPNSYNVTLNTNNGTINSGSIDSYTYGAGATLPNDVTLTGYTFDGWYGNAGFNGDPVNTISTTETGNKEFWAKWTINNYSITVTVNPTEGGSVEGAHNYDHFATATLTATPASGYHFVNWTESGIEVSNSASYVFEVDGARDLVANFAITPAELAWSAESFTGYTMIDFNNWKPTLTNSHNVSVRFGCVEGNVPTQGGVEVDATTGMIGGETGAGYIVHTPGTYQIYAVHDTDPTYYYDSVVYTLNVERGVIVALLKNIDEAGTAVFADYTTEPTLTHSYSGVVAIVAHGQTVRVQADPATGYHFNSWQVGDNVNGYTPVSTEATYTYTVPDIMSIGIKAVFDTNTYALNVVSANETMGIAAGSTTAKHFLNYEISATPNTGYHFTQWSDGNTQNPRTVTLTENTTYTAEFAVNSYAITTGVLPANSGSVTGAGTFNYGANATLTAIAETGYTFTNWTENGVVVNATNPYEFQVTGARELVANFSLNTYAVSASANPAAGGTVTGADTYNHGASVTVTATANEGYTFVNWTEGGQVVSTNASYTFTFTGARTLVANFTPIIYTVTFNAGTGTCQTESLTGSIESSIDIDAVTATPSTICGNQDWVFAGWSTASVAETTQTPAFVSGTEYIPTDNITLYAVYTKTEQGEGTWTNATSIEVGDILALVCSTANIELSGVSSGYGTKVSYTGSPAGVYPLTVVQGYNGSTYAFKTSDNTYLSWSSGNSLTTNSSIAKASSWNVTFASGNATISNANDNSRKLQYNNNSNALRFACYTSTQTAVQLYKYTASSNTTYNTNPVCYVYAVNVDQNIPHGSVNASQTTDIVAGTEITLTPAMDDGYHFGRWIVTAGNDPVTVENNKFTMPASDVNVSAEFWIDTLTVNATANPTAGGTVSGAGDYEFGDLVTLTATANTGYTFVNWTKDNQEVSTDATYAFTFDGAAGTRTFVANFSLNSYEISVSANPTAGGNVNGGNTYNHGATAMLTANPSTGYHFVNWTKDNVQVSTDAEYSFTVAEAGAYVANFALNSYTIAATANPTAGGAVSGAGTYNHFDNVTLTATVVNGYDFDGWYNGNDQVATSLEYSFVATGDVTLEARFAKRYTITFVPGSHSSSTIEPRQGSSVTAVNIDAVTADPSTLCVAQDWVFAGWSSQAIAETTVAPTTWVSGTAYYPTSDITLYAVYTKTEGAGSNTASIDFSDQGYTNAQDVTDVAISNNVNVTFSKGTSNNAPKYYSNNVAIPAIRCYGGNTFTVTATEASITNITLTFGTGDGNNYISPDDGDYSNGTWTGNANSVEFSISTSSGNNRRIAGMSVTTFSGTITYNSDPECFVYDVVVNPDIEHGTVTANPNTGVIAGTEITLTNTPSEGYHFAGWTVTAGNDPVTVENNKFLMPESDVNVTATFEPDTFTLTINYSIVGGGDAPQSYSNRLPFGTPYSVNTPVIAGLTPSQEVVSGTMPAQDVTVNVTYSTVPYTLTIHYVYADNTPAANDVVRNLAYNVPYSETSPTIEGYTPDQAEVSGTMGEADLEVTVVYSINSHNLTVNYVNETSAQVAESHTATLNYHDNYSVTSPQVAGYAANKSVVSGTMGDADKTETVTYYQVQTNIVDATNCAGTGTGSLTVTAPTGNFEYSLDGVTFQTETQFANLNARDYTLYIRPTGEDYNYSGVWTVNSNITMPVAEASVNPFYCLGDEINLSGNGSSTGSEYTYAWSGPNNFTATDINATIAAAEDIHSGSYTLTVTNTVTNCVSDTTVEVIVNTPNMNGYLFTIATHGDAYANLVGGQATPVFATPTVQHYLADAGCTVTLSNDAQATYEEAGDYTITWTATDACGNIATTTQVLHIVLGTCPVAADVDGNTYPVVALNNICWMAANLRTTHYSDGRLIPNPMVYTSVMYPDATANLDMFGYLYDWTAAMDAANGLVQDANGNVQGICPDGWRMPKENEIRALVNDGVSDIFDLRTTDQWLNNFGTNTTGFSLLPAGCYNANSDRFENLHGDAYIWGVGASAPAQPRVFWADCKCYNWQILDTTTPMGYSVRCVRNN